MIIPEKITDFNRTDEELQAFLVYGICAAGKKAKEVAPKVNSFLSSLVDEDGETLSPFAGLKELIRHDLLDEVMQEHRLGCYNVLRNALWDILFLNLRECSIDDLTACAGIGPKTARFFLVHSREGYEEEAVLDVHILRYLRENGVDAPKQTPQNMEEYNRLADCWKSVSSRLMPNMSNAERDLTVWRMYSKN